MRSHSVDVAAQLLQSFAAEEDFFCTTLLRSFIPSASVARRTPAVAVVRCCCCPVLLRSYFKHPRKGDCHHALLFQKLFFRLLLYVETDFSTGYFQDPPPFLLHSS